MRSRVHSLMRAIFATGSGRNVNCIDFDRRVCSDKETVLMNAVVFLIIFLCSHDDILSRF